MQIDDPATTELRKQIIASKPFLKAIYDEWYRTLANELTPIDGKELELGSGGGYCSDFIPGLITSEAFPCSTVQMVVDAQRMPFEDATLRAIVMTNVMHHLPNVREFFREATRCLRSGGKILMIEPWVTSWSKIVYTRLHHEPFEPNSAEWTFPPRGPLSCANNAMPWIVFEADRANIEKEVSGIVGGKNPAVHAFSLSGVRRGNDAKSDAWIYAWRLVGARKFADEPDVAIGPVRICSDSSSIRRLAELCAVKASSKCSPGRIAWFARPGYSRSRWFGGASSHLHSPTRNITKIPSGVWRRECRRFSSRVTCWTSERTLGTPPGCLRRRSRLDRKCTRSNRMERHTRCSKN